MEIFKKEASKVQGSEVQRFKGSKSLKVGFIGLIGLIGLIG